MRGEVTAADVRRLMVELGYALRQETTVYLVGGTSAVLFGWRASTIDIDLKIVPDSEAYPVLARLKAENWSFLKGVIEGVFTVPGDGAIDFRSVAKVLADIGYSGWVVVEAEQDPKKANPLEMARIGHAALTKAFGQAGFRIA